MEHSIITECLCKSFGEKQVLNSISLKVKKGEIFGLLGPSGAGKTTFLNILTGQIQADSGKGLIFGQNIREFTAQMYTRIGMLLDNCGLYARLSGYQNLKIMSIIYGLSDDEIIEVLKEVELLADKDKAVFRMSKGMQQRLAFAKAILNKPEILFLDEPTTGLDPVTTGYIHNMIKKLAEKGTTIILTTHNMDEAAKLCDNVGMLYEGKIVEYGNPQELCYRYRVENLFRVISNDDEEIYIENNESGRKKAAEMLVHNEIKSIHTVETTLQTIFVKLTGKELENESVMYKQFCDTLKNKLLLLLIFMYPVLAYIFYFLLKDTQEAVNIVIPIFITMHIIMAPIVCMSSIISEEKEKNTIKVLLFSGIRSYEYLLGVAGVLMGILIVSVIPYLFILKFDTEQTLLFFYFIILGFLCSMLLGSVIGIMSKNQMSVGTISSPLSMFIGLLPMASIFNDSVDKASKILYSKRIYDVVYSFMGEMKTDIGIDTGVCVANMAVLILVFCFVYTKSGKMSQ